MDSSLTKGVLNFPPRYMPKHVSGDTDVDQTAQTKNRPQWCLTCGPGDFTIFGKNNIPFGLGGCWDLWGMETGTKTIVRVLPSLCCAAMRVKWPVRHTACCRP
jgi:predicted amidohydrolase